MDSNALAVWTATLYTDQYAGFQSDPVFNQVVREELRANFVPRIRPPARILDVGCGNGDFLAAAREAGYTVKGVDISEAAVELCENRGIVATAGNFVDLQGAGPVEFVTMWDVVEHLPDPQAYFRQAFKCLRPGGYLVIKTPYVAWQTMQLVRIFPRLSGVLLQVPEHIQWFSRQTLEIALRHSGFERLVWLTDRPMRARRRARTLKKALAHGLIQVARWMGRNGNLYVMAQKPEIPRGPQQGRDVIVEAGLPVELPQLN